ncbi:gliding motility-associated C-terminal domain-containing protein [Hymenobacter gummosus]|nr:gliding motility-associated C-terminal domain-containing protein [Hymenobacter gummosus]
MLGLLGSVGAAVGQIPGFSWVVSCVPINDANDIGHRRALAADQWGNNYVTGRFEGTTQFGPFALSAPGRGKLFVAKLDAVGNYQWVASISGDDEDSQGQSIALDRQGNAYVTGYVAGSNLLFGNVRVPNTSTNGYSDVFVAKISPTGTWLWATRAGSRATDIGRSIAVDTAGNAYVAGVYYGETVTFGNTQLPAEQYSTDVFVAKLNPQGQWQWAVRAGGPAIEDVGGIAVGRRGQVAVAGYFQGQARFGSQRLNAPGWHDVFVAQLTTAGQWQWAVQAGGAGSDAASSIAADTIRHEWLVTGSFAGPVGEFGSFRLPAATQTAFVARLDTAGQFRWATAPTGTSNCQHVAVDGSSQAYLLGNFNDQLRLGSTTLSYANPISRLYGALFVARLAADGTWGPVVAAGNSSNGYGTSLALDGSGNAYLTGFMLSQYAQGTSADFPPLQLATPRLATTGFVACLRAIPAADDVMLCAGGQIELVGPAGATRYQWSTRETTPRIVVRQPGIYHVTATQADGRLVQQRYQVRLFSFAGTQGLGSDTTLCHGTQLLLRAPTHGSLPLTYRWSDGSTGASLLIHQPGQYSVEVTSACGSYTARRRVDFDHCGALTAALIPNIITPNNDGSNDVFRVPGLTRQPVAWALTVYNRWGAQIYTTSAYHNDWGRDAPAGTYYYQLRAADGSQSVRGWLEVVR